ncbi:hypothetical protein ACG2Y5_002592 [Listeria monocytogenes]|uniref:beta-sandwich lipoprotein n=1 Tax=Listeria monocytogenes TaxID=1639 RepID=UPI0012890D0F|nr:hypothetical protein [Listeria monocytogenes]ECC0876460.1 hypothetical protein [Listeria monocytogenes]ECC2007917.1 hypothetical protein [Listeria monocytogenes]ECH5294735.1 hypothetical protein [Listeria monocytogenes]ECK6821639.1 hypothetical protein [Listeria monocytogenes]EKY5046041.1 hypothetical protein [Listeria monocytogenes]
MKKLLLSVLLISTLTLTLTACTEADKVSQNVSKEADNFNVTRRVAIINVRTDKVEFEVIGRISVDTSDEDKLVIIAEVADGKYKKHLVNMTSWNMYVVEDLDGAEVNKYKYEVNYMPESIIPYSITNSK